MTDETTPPAEPAEDTPAAAPAADTAELTPAPLPEPEPPSFAAMNLDEPILQALAEMGYAEPMEVQVAVHDQVRGGRDIMVQSRTGSGKTAAFGIPICQMIRADEAGRL